MESTLDTSREPPLRIPDPLRAAAAVPLAAAVILPAAPQASAGLIDGSLNNLHVLDQANILGALVNSRIGDSNNNNGNGRNIDFGATMRDAPGVTCEITATATDPDGATGTVSVAVPAADAQTELYFRDQRSGTRWGVGDLDHVAGQLTCSDARTGALVGMVAIDTDEIAA